MVERRYMHGDGRGSAAMSRDSQNLLRSVYEPGTFSDGASQSRQMKRLWDTSDDRYTHSPMIQHFFLFIIIFIIVICDLGIRMMALNFYAARMSRDGLGRFSLSWYRYRHAIVAIRMTIKVHREKITCSWLP